MAIHAKKSGMMIGGRVISENENNWIFHSADNKFPTVILKSDVKQKVFDGESAVDDAEAWILSVRKG